MASAGRQRENADRYKCEPRRKTANAPTGQWRWCLVHTCLEARAHKHTHSLSILHILTRMLYFSISFLSSHTEGNSTELRYQWRSSHCTAAAQTILAAIWNRPRVRWGLNCVGTRPEVSSLIIYQHGASNHHHYIVVRIVMDGRTEWVATLIQSRRPGLRCPVYMLHLASRCEKLLHSKKVCTSLMWSAH